MCACECASSAERVEARGCLGVRGPISRSMQADVRGQPLPPIHVRLLSLHGTDSKEWLTKRENNEPEQTFRPTFQRHRPVRGVCQKIGPLSLPVLRPVPRASLYRRHTAMARENKRKTMRLMRSLVRPGQGLNYIGLVATLKF